MGAVLDQQAVEQNVIQTFRRGQCVGNALSGVFVEVQPERSESQVEIDDGGCDLE